MAKLRKLLHINILPPINWLSETTKGCNGFANIAHNTFDSSLSSSIGPLAWTDSIPQFVDGVKLLSILLNDSRRETGNTAGSSNDGSIVGKCPGMKLFDSVDKIPAISQVNIIDSRINAMLYNIIIGRLEWPACVDNYFGFSLAEIGSVVMIDIQYGSLYRCMLKLFQQSRLLCLKQM